MKKFIHFQLIICCLFTQQILAQKDSSNKWFNKLYIGVQGSIYTQQMSVNDPSGFLNVNLGYAANSPSNSGFLLGYQFNEKQALELGLVSITYTNPISLRFPTPIPSTGVMFSGYGGGPFSNGIWRVPIVYRHELTRYRRIGLTGIVGGALELDNGSTGVNSSGVTIINSIKDTYQIVKQAGTSAYVQAGVSADWHMDERFTMRFGYSRTWGTAEVFVVKHQIEEGGKTYQSETSSNGGGQSYTLSLHYRFVRKPKKVYVSKDKNLPNNVTNTFSDSSHYFYFGANLGKVGNETNITSGDLLSPYIGSKSAFFGWKLGYQFHKKYALEIGYYSMPFETMLSFIPNQAEGTLFNYRYIPLRLNRTIICVGKSLKLIGSAGVGLGIVDAQNGSTSFLGGGFGGTTPSLFQFSDYFLSKPFTTAELGLGIDWKWSSRMTFSLYGRQTWGLSSPIRTGRVDYYENSVLLKSGTYESKVDGFSISIGLKYNFGFRQRYVYLDK